MFSAKSDLGMARNWPAIGSIPGINHWLPIQMFLSREFTAIRKWATPTGSLPLIFGSFRF
jgi:hypothetical protein